MSDPKDQEKKHESEDVVITPAGPRSKDQVHRVGPGKAVRRNPDGTFTVVPETPPEDCEKEGKNG